MILNNFSTLLRRQLFTDNLLRNIIVYTQFSKQTSSFRPAQKENQTSNMGWKKYNISPQYLLLNFKN